MDDTLYVDGVAYEKYAYNSVFRQTNMFWAMDTEELDT